MLSKGEEVAEVDLYNKLLCIVCSSFSLSFSDNAKVFTFLDITSNSSPVFKTSELE